MASLHVRLCLSCLRLLFSRNAAGEEKEALTNAIVRYMAIFKLDRRLVAVTSQGFHLRQEIEVTAGRMSDKCFLPSWQREEYEAMMRIGCFVWEGEKL